MKKVAILASVALTTMLVSTPALSAGQFGWLENSPVSHFTDDDWARLRETARNTLNNAEDGTKAEWSNPSTGAEGSVQVLNTYEEDGRTCRRTKFYNSAGGLTGGGVYPLCQVEGGSWKIAY